MAFGVKLSETSDAMDLKDTVRSRLDELGRSPFEAARRGGLQRHFVNDILAGKKRSVRGDNLARLAQGLDWTVEELLGGASITNDLREIVGYVGADPEGVVLFGAGQGTGDFAPAPPYASSSARCLEVRGHSMPFFAEDGSLIWFDDQRAEPDPEMIGHVVVCELDTDEVLVKRLLRGSAPGLYDLESIAGPTRRDARLRWVARITAVIPPLQARRVIVRSEAA